jgi:hypothetical protein
MITLTEVIEVERPVEACFRYVSDFRTTVEWDATAVAARKLSPGPVGKGSHFSVLCKAGPTKLRLDYCITEFTEPRPDSYHLRGRVSFSIWA